MAWDGGPCPNRAGGCYRPAAEFVAWGGARLVPLAQYVAALRVAAFAKNVLLVAQDEFPQATNMDTTRTMQVNPAHQCKCCGLKGHQVDACGFSGTIPATDARPPWGLESPNPTPGQEVEAGDQVSRQAF